MAGIWKEVKVFISSTFKDMHSERDHLVKVVFPELRERLTPHRIHLVDIDLRWGLTEQQVADKRVLGLCLEQVDECRPFFIGILGERYGYVPESLPDDALGKHGWLRDQEGKSLTALEITYGALLDHAAKMHSFFYFREPAFIQDVPPPARPQVQSRGLEDARRLADLKGEIRRAALSTHSYSCRYRGMRVIWSLVRSELDPARQQALEAAARDGLVDPQEYAVLTTDARADLDRYGCVQVDGLEGFGRAVLDDLWEAICNEHPELTREQTAGRASDIARASAQSNEWLAEEQSLQERFAETKTKLFVGREPVLQKLEAYIESNQDRPLLLIGPVGCGKSSILSRLCQRYQGRCDLLIPHFIGAGPDSTGVAKMLLRLCLLLKERLGLAAEIPQAPGQLSSALRDLLWSAPRDNKVLVAIDGLDQLDEDDRNRGLSWLPQALPPSARFVLSCSQDEANGSGPLRPFGDANLPTITVPMLSDEERIEIIRTLPSVAAKTLDERQTRLLLQNQATANPLFLTVALEELRGFGSFDLLTSRIESFPSGKDGPLRLFDQVIERLEQDFGKSLVRSILTWLASSRQGLSQAEITGLVELEELVEGTANLFPALRQLRPYLMHRNNLMDFFSTSLKKAVSRRYLKTSGHRIAAHLALARYFGDQPLGPRKLRELPYQLAEARAWEQLYCLLADPSFFTAAWQTDTFEALHFWSLVEAGSDLRKVDAYEDVLESPGVQAEHVWSIADLFYATGHLDECLKLREHQLVHYRDLEDLPNYATTLGNQAGLFFYRGELDRSLALLEEQQGIWEQLGYKQGLQKCLAEQANVFYLRRELDRAMKLYKEQESLCEELGDRNSLQASLSNQANVLCAQGELDQAMKLYKEQERICKDLGNQEGLHTSLGNQAFVLESRGELDRAMELYAEKQRICVALGNKEGLQSSFGHLARIFHARGQVDRALSLIEEQERLCWGLGNKSGLVHALINRAAWLAIDKKRPAEALPLAENAYKIAVDHRLDLIVSRIKPILDAIRSRTR